jgi:hypothetical protein
MGLFSRKARQIVFPALALAAVTAIYFNGKKVQSRFLDDDFLNSTYLSDTTYFAPGGRLSQYLFGQKAARSAWEQLYQERETKRNYGLLDANSEQIYHEQFVKLSQSALIEMQRNHAGNAMRTAQESTELRDVRTPAAILAVMAAVYTGRLVEYRAIPGMKLRSQTFIRNSRMDRQYLGVDGRLLSGSIDYLGEHLAGQSHTDYRATVAAHSEPVGARAGAAYSLKSQSVTMTLSKQVTETVSVSYDWTDPNSDKTGHAVGVGFTSGF